MKITTGTQIFDNMLGDIYYSPDSAAGKLYPFKVRVGCVKIRPPRHKFFEFIIEMGMTNIEKVLQGKPIKKKNLTFVFPERSMGIHEIYMFMSKMNSHPEASKFEQVDIITSSPILIGDFMKEHIRILTWDDDYKYMDQKP